MYNCPMKHAYLIIAHHEFDILNKLIQAIDDERNDIFIHFDKKVRNCPSLTAHYSNLYILEKRIDIRWGHCSQIEAEYLLFETAGIRDEYHYYHLLSGVHLPLKSHQVLFIRRLNQLLWRFSICIQRELRIFRNRNQQYVNASNWVSVPHHCVTYLLQIKKDVLRKYRFTLCGDEFFIPSELENSYLKDRIYYDDRLLKCDFEGGANPRVYTLADYDELVNSGCLFARKFSHMDMDIVDKILNHILVDVKG